MMLSMRVKFFAVCAVLVAGCGFPRPADVVDLAGGDAGQDPHGPQDAQGSQDPQDAADAPPDAFEQCAPGFVNVCAETRPTESFKVTANLQINTASDSRCRDFTLNGTALCLIYVTSFQVAQGATLTAVGSKPLAIVSMSVATVAGVVDVSSHLGAAQQGAGSGACVNTFPAEGGSVGSGAGGGGSLFGTGGRGGDGTANSGGIRDGSPPTPVITVVNTVRAGCSGGAGGSLNNVGGAAGTGGGAIYIAAWHTVTVSGSVRANGAGGGAGGIVAGGGGGGSGGSVMLEAPTVSVMSGAKLSANGGGGGEGGGSAASTHPGADGTVGSGPAPGGSAVGGSTGGDGGNGAAGALAGTNGASDNAAGGGGGGGAGIVWVKATTADVGMGDISPPVTTP
jgi:hypothetical protein